jgi:PIN domain nuclease of toxin-antitoxin system
MDILLDTCSFLWLTLEPEKLSDRAMREFESPANTIFLSSVSSWEIAIKYQLNKLYIPAPPAVFIPQAREHQNIASLQLSEEHSFHLSQLPLIHKDPFDRILICQAIENGMAILTSDSFIQQYPVKVIW